MELKSLRLIKSIADEGSIANSSKQLFLTQSAISHQLKELETQLGITIFRRSRNNWALTEEGDELYQLAESVLKDVDKSLQKIQGLKSGSVGDISVSTECYSFYQSLPQFIQKMSLMYPEINVDLNLEATHQPISKLLSGEIDIAITTTKPEDSKLVSIEVYEDEILAIIHQDNKLSEKQFITASDFREEQLIIHSFPIDTVSVYEHYLKPNKEQPKKVIAIPLTEVALEMVSANVGIMCMPKWALKSFILPNQIDFIKIGEEGLKRKHYLVVRNQDLGKKYIQDFINNFSIE